MHSLSARVASVAVVAAVAAGLAAGCGGGGSDGVPLESWRAQAEQICVVTRQQADASQPVTGAGNPAVPVRARAALIDTQSEQIAALGEPAEEADVAGDLVDAMERQAAALDSLADALLADPAAAAGQVGIAATAETDRVAAAAGTLGLSSCTVQETSSAGPAEGTSPGGVPSDGDDGGQGFATEDG